MPRNLVFFFNGGSPSFLFQGGLNALVSFEGTLKNGRQACLFTVISPFFKACWLIVMQDAS